MIKITYFTLLVVIAIGLNACKSQTRDENSRTITATATNVAFVDVSGSNTTGIVNNAARPFATIQAAYDALPSGGGVVKIGIGTFVAPTTTTKANTIFIGSGRPEPNWTLTQTTVTSTTYGTPTALTGGTIIQGGMNFLGIDGIKFYDCGIDVGSAYITAGGTAMNGLGFGNTANNEAANTPTSGYTFIKGIEIQNVTVLLPNSTSLFHCIVMENCFKPVVNNVLLVYGTHGLAIKTAAGRFTNITTFYNNSDGIIVKSNNYSVASQNIIDGFNINSATTGIIIENKSTTVLKDNTFLNGFINLCTTGVNAVDDLGNGFAGNSFTNVVTRGSTTAFSNSTKYSLINCFAEGVFTQNVVAGTIATGANLTFSSNDATLTNTSGTWASSSTNAAWGHLGLSGSYLPASTSGRIYFTATVPSGSTAVFGLHTSNAYTAYASMFAELQLVATSNGSFCGNNGTFGGSSNFTWVSGRYYGIYRDGASGVIKAQESTDQINWTDKYTYTVTSTAALYIVGDWFGGTNVNLVSPKLQ